MKEKFVEWVFASSEWLMNQFGNNVFCLIIGAVVGAALAWFVTYALMTNCPLVYVVDKRDGTEVGYGLRGRTRPLNGDLQNHKEEY